MASFESPARRSPRVQFLFGRRRFFWPRQLLRVTLWERAAPKLIDFEYKRKFNVDI